MTNILRRTFAFVRPKSWTHLSDYLPDSWFVLTISVLLALATFWIQRFVDDLPFWQAVVEKKAYWKLHQVIIDEYHQNHWQSKTIATDLYIENHSDITKTEGSTNRYVEHWRLNHWYLMTFDENGQDFYRMQSTKAIIEKENHQITLSDGLTVIGFRTSAQQDPYLQLTADRGIYHYREGQLYFPEKIAMIFEGDRLIGHNSEMNLHENTLSIKQAKAWLKTPLSEPSTAPNRLNKKVP